MPVADDMELAVLPVALDQGDSPKVGPAGHAQRVQAAQKAAVVGFLAFLAPADAGALVKHGAKAGPARRELFQPERAVAQPVLVGEVVQRLQGGIPAAEQAIEARLGGEVDVLGIDHLGPSVLHAQGAQLAAAPQLLVQQGLLQLDQPGFEQQRADLAGRADVADAVRLAQQAGFVGIAQVRQHPAAQVDALANVERQAAFFAMEDVHPWRARHVSDGFAQVGWIFIRPGGLELGVALDGKVHGSGSVRFDAGSDRALGRH